MRLSVASIAIAFVLAVLLGMSGGGDAAEAATSSTLSVLGGDVAVRHAGGEFTTAIDGATLVPGDTIRTGDGRAIVTYFEGSTVTVEPNTELTIDAMSTAADGGTIVLMTQAFGRTWHVVTKLISGGSRYDIRTPGSTASVRGTEFALTVDDDATTVSTTEGTVMHQVIDGSGMTTDVPVTAGRTQTQPRRTAPAPSVPMPAPRRTVSVSVTAASGFVVDPLGRSNGVTPDGKVVAQTPGARVRRVGDAIVVTMPELPDGRIAARVDGHETGATVTTTVEEHGRTATAVARTLSAGDGSATAVVSLAHAADGDVEAMPIDARDAPPTPKVPRGAGSRRSLAPDATARPGTDAHATAAPIVTGDHVSAQPRIRWPSARRVPSPDPRDRARPTASPDRR